MVPHSDPAVSDCRLCRASGALRDFARLEGHQYWRCDVCGATLLDPAHFPEPAAEHTHYQTHHNAPGDPGYRRFLSRLAEPLMARLPRGSAGLDYGAGPGPALAAMLREAGHRVALWDPVFHPDPAPLEQQFDFVACTETVEHFHHPAHEFDRLFGLVRPGGWLAVMTCFQTDDARFAGWRYRKDPTHVIFYRADTLRHLARMRGWSCEVPCKDVALMRRPAP